MARDYPVPSIRVLRRLILYFLKLGALGFGGPIALAGAMQRDLVDDRQWITRDEYLRGLGLAQLAPGPLAAQLAMYLGWVRGGVAGATLVGIAFVLPSFVMVVALAALYIHFHGLVWMQAAFYGVGAAVIGVIARSAAKLTTLALKRDGCCGRSSPSSPSSPRGLNAKWCGCFCCQASRCSCFARGDCRRRCWRSRRCC
jgi:chromate transport protein ChrA